MSYMLDYKGIKIIAESADEAVELARKLAGETDPPKSPKANPEDAVNQLIAFWKALDPVQRQVLVSLTENADGLATDSLAEATGIEATRLKYALRSIQSQAVRHNVDALVDVLRDRIYVDKKPKSRYRLKAKGRQSIQTCLAKFQQS